MNGLSLVMNVDAEIDDDEKEYLRILLKSFEMAESLLEEFVRFSKEPDKDTIQAFFQNVQKKRDRPAVPVRRADADPPRRKNQ